MGCKTHGLFSSTPRTNQEFSRCHSLSLSIPPSSISPSLSPSLPASLLFPPSLPPSLPPLPLPSPPLNSGGYCLIVCVCVCCFVFFVFFISLSLSLSLCAPVWLSARPSTFLCTCRLSSLTLKLEMMIVIELNTCKGNVFRMFTNQRKLKTHGLCGCYILDYR